MSWNSLETFLLAVQNFFFSAWMTGLLYVIYKHRVLLHYIIKKKKKKLNERAMKNEQERLNNKATGHT